MLYHDSNVWEINRSSNIDVLKIFLYDVSHKLNKTANSELQLGYYTQTQQYGLTVQQYGAIGFNNL